MSTERLEMVGRYFIDQLTCCVWESNYSILSHMNNEIHNAYRLAAVTTENLPGYHYTEEHQRMPSVRYTFYWEAK